MSTIVFFLILLSATLHALWNFAAKKVAGDMAVIWAGLAMASLAFVPFIFFIDPGQVAFQRVFPYMIVSGIIEAIYFFAVGRAYEHGDISVVYPIARGVGISGTALVAFSFLHEKASVLGVVGIMIVIFGVFLLGFKNGGHKHSLSFALLVGLMMIGYSITDKLAMGISHPIFYSFGFTVFMTCLLAPYVIIKKNSELKEAWRNKKKYSLVIGLGTTIAYIIILYLYQIAQVSYVVATREIAVVIGAILGFVFLKERLTARKAIGVAAVVAGIILIKVS